MIFNAFFFLLKCILSWYFWKIQNITSGDDQAVHSSMGCMGFMSFACYTEFFSDSYCSNVEQMIFANHVCVSQLQFDCIGLK